MNKPPCLIKKRDRLKRRVRPGFGKICAIASTSPGLIDSTLCFLLASPGLFPTRSRRRFDGGGGVVGCFAVDRPQRRLRRRRLTAMLKGRHGSRSSTTTTSPRTKESTEVRFN